MTDPSENRPDTPDGHLDALAALLTSGAVWAAADPMVEDRVVADVAAELQAWPRVPTAPGREDRRHLRIIAVAAVVFLAAAVGIGLLAQGSDDTDSFALAGTELAEQASATATVEETPSGVRVVLDVRDLAPAGDGHYYQAWVRNDDGQAVTIGTFHMDGGDDEIELWAGVTAADYPIISVTIQEQGAGAESSGLFVLNGTAGG
jgi:hypothetical protein